MTIDPVLPVWSIICLLIGLLAISVVIEWRRPLRFRALRLLACVIAVAALCVIFLRPAYPADAGRQTILLTEAYNAYVVDSLRRIFPRAELYHLGERGYMNSSQVRSYRELISPQPEPMGSGVDKKAIGPVTAIVGQGLPSYVLDSIPGNFLYAPSPVPNGITSLSFPKKRLSANEPVNITGTYQAAGIPARLLLSGPAGKLDSVSVSSSSGAFSFTFTPRVSGRITYSLSLTDSMGTRVNETVPLFVEGADPLSILMLQHYPTFEMQHLKNFLSDRGHEVAMRAQLSRNIYRVEFSNRREAALKRLTLPLLAQFDVLVADPTVLAQLSPGERSSIESSMREGLGLIVVFDGVPANLPVKSLLPINFAGVASDTTSVLLSPKRISLPVTRLRPTGFDGAVVTNNSSRILSGYTSVREGMAGFQLLRGTYSVLLSGDSLGYGSIWSPLLNAVARRRDVTGSIQVTSEFPTYRNEPLELNLISASTPRLYADSVRIPVREDAIIDDLWNATVWTDNAGWHELRTETDTASYYIFEGDDWNALRVAQQQAATHVASLRPGVSGQETERASPISLTACWILFLLASGFLWLAPKL